MTHTSSAARRAERRTTAARVAVLRLTAAFAGVAGCGAGLATEPGSDPSTNPGTNPGTNPNTNPGGLPAGEHPLLNIERVSLPARTYSGSGTDPITRRYYNQLAVVINDGGVNKAFLEASQ